MAQLAVIAVSVPPAVARHGTLAISHPSPRRLEKQARHTRIAARDSRVLARQTCRETRLAGLVCALGEVPCPAVQHAFPAFTRNRQEEVVRVAGEAFLRFRGRAALAVGGTGRTRAVEQEPPRRTGRNTRCRCQVQACLTAQTVAAGGSVAGFAGRVTRVAGLLHVVREEASRTAAAADSQVQETRVPTRQTVRVERTLALHTLRIAREAFALHLVCVEPGVARRLTRAPLQVVPISTGRALVIGVNALQTDADALLANAVRVAATVEVRPGRAGVCTEPGVNIPHFRRGTRRHAGYASRQEEVVVAGGAPRGESGNARLAACGTRAAARQRCIHVESRLALVATDPCCHLHCLLRARGRFLHVRHSPPQRRQEESVVARRAVLVVWQTCTCQTGQVARDAGVVRHLLCIPVRTLQGTAEVVVEVVGRARVALEVELAETRRATSRARLAQGLVLIHVEPVQTLRQTLSQRSGGRRVLQKHVFSAGCAACR